MEIVPRVMMAAVMFIPFVIHPSLFQLIPSENRQDRFVFAVEEDELAGFRFHRGDPVAPTVNTEERRDPASKITRQLAPGAVCIMPSDHLQIAAKGMGGPGQLDIVCSGPPVRPRDFRNVLLIREYSEHEEPVFERKWTTLPDIWLRINAHGVRRKICDRDTTQSLAELQE